MRRGRPVNSVIRQNIQDILFYLGKGYGYDIYRYYIQIYPKVTLRSIYYHLNKGVTLEVFEVEKIQKEKGEYSWGEFAEKIYYKLGKNANPKKDPRIKELIKNGKSRSN